MTADILVAENLFWTNYTAGNTSELGKQLTPDFQNVEQEIWSRAQVLGFVRQFFRQCSLAPVKIVDPTVVFLTPAIATTTYRAVETPTCGGRSMSGDTNISTFWVFTPASPDFTAGHWQMHLHTEYAVPAEVALLHGQQRQRRLGSAHDGISPLVPRSKPMPRPDLHLTQPDERHLRRHSLGDL